VKRTPRPSTHPFTLPPNRLDRINSLQMGCAGGGCGSIRVGEGQPKGEACRVGPWRWAPRLRLWRWALFNIIFFFYFLIRDEPCPAPILWGCSWRAGPWLLPQHARFPSRNWKMRCKHARTTHILPNARDESSRILRTDPHIFVFIYALGECVSLFLVVIFHLDVMFWHKEARGHGICHLEIFCKRGDRRNGY
jgi:hypothetical protein